MLRPYNRRGRKELSNMVFSDLKFIFLFMPIFFTIYYLVPSKCKNFIIVIGSLFFYMIGSIQYPEHIIVFVSCILLDYMCGLLMEEYPKKKKALLLLNVITHILLLGTFKYANFVISEVNQHLWKQNLIINVIQPIGISFYSFQGMAYVIDVYRGKIKAEHSLIDFTAFIAMFAQLIAGPIVTYETIIKEIKYRKIKKTNFINGLCTFTIGLGLKVLLANPIGKLWTQIGSIGYESISTPLAWIGAFAFSFQIYFDFFGYSLMAIGLGKMMGFHIPTNFYHPYISKSMTEFWRRWHITLGAWFREYVYIPLGGNRRGTICLIRNLMVVWLLTGIWHGAGYNFIIWGAMLFLLITLEKFCYGKWLETHPFAGHLYMLLFIPLSWSIFAIDDIQQLSVFLTKLFPFFGNQGQNCFAGDYMKYLSDYYPFFIVAFILSTGFPFYILKRLRSKVGYKILVCVIFIASTYCLYKGFNDPFLYFRF